MLFCKNPDFKAAGNLVNDNLKVNKLVLLAMSSFQDDIAFQKIGYFLCNSSILLFKNLAARGINPMAFL